MRVYIDPNLLVCPHNTCLSTFFFLLPQLLNFCFPFTSLQAKKKIEKKKIKAMEKKEKAARFPPKRGQIKFKIFEKVINAIFCKRREKKCSGCGGGGQSFCPTRQQCLPFK